MPTSVLDSGFNETSNVLLSDYYIENASFLKMDNINLGYTIEDKFKNERASIRVWAGVQNVFTINIFNYNDSQ